jgi:hypothetical protein
MTRPRPRRSLAPEIDDAPAVTAREAALRAARVPLLWFVVDEHEAAALAEGTVPLTVQQAARRLVAEWPWS